MDMLLAAFGNELDHFDKVCLLFTTVVCWWGRVRVCVIGLCWDGARIDVRELAFERALGVQTAYAYACVHGRLLHTRDTSLNSSLHHNRA